MDASTLGLTIGRWLIRDHNRIDLAGAPYRQGARPGGVGKHDSWEDHLRRPKHQDRPFDRGRARSSLFCRLFFFSLYFVSAIPCGISLWGGWCPPNLKKRKKTQKNTKTGLAAGPARASPGLARGSIPILRETPRGRFSFKNSGTKQMDQCARGQAIGRVVLTEPCGASRSLRVRVCGRCALTVWGRADFVLPPLLARDWTRMASRNDRGGYAIQPKGLSALCVAGPRRKRSFQAFTAHTPRPFPVARGWRKKQKKMR